MAKSFMQRDFEERLFNFYNLERSIKNIEEELEVLENKLIGGGVKFTAFNSGGSDYNAVENKYNNIISRQMFLDCELKTNQFYYKHIKAAFENALNKFEKKIVEEYFFLHIEVEKIDVNYQPAQKYRYIERAVTKMLYYIYGTRK